MMIVVFGHEVQMVDQSHWRSKSRMRDRSGEQVGFKVAESIHEPQSCLSKLHKNILDAALVMPRFMSFSIAQVGGCEFSDGCEVIVDSRHPQGLEVKQVSSMLLRRPLFSRFLH
jgi:hypothetical protein